MTWADASASGALHAGDVTSLLAVASAIDDVAVTCELVAAHCSNAAGAFAEFPMTPEVVPVKDAAEGAAVRSRRLAESVAEIAAAIKSAADGLNGVQQQARTLQQEAEAAGLTLDMHSGEVHSNVAYLGDPDGSLGLDPAESVRVHAAELRDQRERWATSLRTQLAGLVELLPQRG